MLVVLHHGDVSSRPAEGSCPQAKEQNGKLLESYDLGAPLLRATILLDTARWYYCGSVLFDSTHLRTVSKSLPTSTGFARCSWKPARFARSASSARA